MHQLKITILHAVIIEEKLRVFIRAASIEINYIYLLYSSINPIAFMDQLTFTSNTNKDADAHREQLPSQIDLLLTTLKKRFYKSEEFDYEFSNDYYVQPSGESSDSTNSPHVLERLQSFLNTPSQRSLLVLGDWEEKKSTLARYLVWRLWNDFKPGDLVPIFINLPRILSQQRAESLLQAGLEETRLTSSEIAYLQSNHQLLIVLDGQDEISDGEKLISVK